MLAAYGLSQREHDVTVLSCLGALPRCPVLDMHNLDGDSPARSSVCRGCRRSMSNGTSKFGQKHVPLDMYIDRNRLAVEAQRVADLGDQWASYEFEGLKIGLMAAHDLMLAFKTVDPERLTGKQLERATEFILAGVSSYLALKHLCTEDNYTHVLMFNHYVYQSSVIMEPSALVLKPL